MVSKFISRGAAGYDAYMGRWSRRLAPRFLDFAGIGARASIADIGCGTGSLTFEIASRPTARRIEAIDYEADFVAALVERNKDPRVHVQQGDACTLPFGDNAFDCALSMLVLHFVSDAQSAIDEMKRVLREGGIAAATVWDTFGGMPSQRIFWDTAAALEPTAVARRAGSINRPMTRPGELRSGFEKAGFIDISETLLTIEMDFENFDDYWHPLLEGQGTLKDYLDGLPGTTRGRIENAVRESYLAGFPDGARTFASVARAVRGHAP